MSKTLKGIIVGLFMFNGLSSAMAEQSINSVPQVQQLAQQVEAELHGTDPLFRYHAYKAKMWLSYAKSEISAQGLSSAGLEALQQAQHLVDGFNQPTQLSLTTPVLSMAQVMRRDLWVQLEYLKGLGAIHVAPERLAKAEVTLVWAAAEYCELGWRHAREHFQAAERTIFKVQQQLPYVVMTSDAFDLPSLLQLNGHGCQGVNAQYWPLLNIAQIPVQSSRSSEGNQK